MYFVEDYLLGWLCVLVYFFFGCIEVEVFCIVGDEEGVDFVGFGFVGVGYDYVYGGFFCFGDELFYFC